MPSFNPTQHRAETVAHYTRLGQLPSWTRYVSHELKRLEQVCPGMYGGIHAEVNQAIKAKQAEKSVLLIATGATHDI